MRGQELYINARNKLVRAWLVLIVCFGYSFLIIATAILRKDFNYDGIMSVVQAIVFEFTREHSGTYNLVKSLWIQQIGIFAFCSRDNVGVFKMIVQFIASFIIVKIWGIGTEIVLSIIEMIQGGKELDANTWLVLFVIMGIIEPIIALISLPKCIKGYKENLQYKHASKEYTTSYARTTTMPNYSPDSSWRDYDGRDKSSFSYNSSYDVYSSYDDSYDYSSRNSYDSYSSYESFKKYDDYFYSYESYKESESYYTSSDSYAIYESYYSS